MFKAYGGDPLGLWGETEPDELLQWWLRIAAHRQTWRRSAGNAMRCVL